MSKQESKTNQCPKCKFAGNEKFPKGFAPENHVKTDKKGVLITNNKGAPQFFQINRCPDCGHQERVE